MKKYSEEWWIQLMEGHAEPAYAFNDDVLVFSEMAVRAIVIKAIKTEVRHSKEVVEDGK